MSESGIFKVAVKLPPDRRADFLKEACGSNTELRSEVESLLRAHDASDSFLCDDASQQRTADYVPIAERPGSEIGPYRLMEQIGEGGFGLVFVAHQEQPVRRKIALKIVKPGMDSREVIARFEAERQALALMDHPNIAKVFDAGTTPSGRPYFVMELVKGIPIVDYCDQQQLTARQRLELFESVCRAVQHAHGKGIIHRDIKPSNILVAPHDGVPVIKVIDFGIAKALGQKLTDKTIYTRFLQMIGTPLYMSPEQAEINALDVDIRSDVYSLGVLLYELLTGTTPFDRERFATASYDEIRRIIREEEPPKPSMRLSTMGESVTKISLQRKTEPARLSAELRGDLDWIVMKALEKDRNRRYETANSFAADVRRFLADEPIEARPPSAWYRLGKFARRNKVAVSLIGLVLFFIVLIGGGIGWVVRDRAARDYEVAHDREVREAALDGEVSRALDETGPLIDQVKWPEALAEVERADKLLAAAGREERPQRLLDLRRDLTMAQSLDAICREPRPTLKSDVSGPLQPTKMSTEEAFFWGRNQDERFAQAFRGYGIDIEALGPSEAAKRIASSSIRRALVRALDEWAALRRRDRGDKDPFWKTLIETARQADPDLWRNRFRQASLSRNRQELKQLADAVDRREVPPATLWLLGIELMELGAKDKAMAVLQEAQHLYPDDDKINDILGWFSLKEFDPPRHDDALRYYMVACALRPRLPRHHRAVAGVQMARGAIKEAIAEYTRVVELAPDDGENWELRGDAYWRIREFDKALADYARAISLDPKNAQRWYNRGVAYYRLQRPEKAVADCTKAIELDPKFSWAYNLRGGNYHRMHQNPKALADFNKAIELDPKFATPWNNRGWLYLESRQYDKAVAEFSKAIELEPKFALYWNNRGRAYYQLDQHDKAVADFTKNIELDVNSAGAWHDRGLAYEGLGAWDKALADWLKALELRPKSVFYLNKLAWLLATCPDTKFRDPVRAVELAGKAVKIAPKDADAWNTLGVSQYRAGAWKEGIASLIRSMELHRGRLESFDTFFLAMAHWRLGEKVEANKWYDRAIEWMAKNRRNLEKDPRHLAELERYRAEAEELLGMKRK